MGLYKGHYRIGNSGVKYPNLSCQFVVLYNIL